MKNVIFYFSSTGNSLFVAKKVASIIGNCEIKSIITEFNNAASVYDYDRIGFICPIYASGIPPMVYNFISKIKLNKNAYVFAVECSGGGTGIAFSMINEALKKNNNPLISNGERISFKSNYIRAGRNHPIGNEALEMVNSTEPKILSLANKVKNKEIYPIKDTNITLQKLLYTMWRDFYKNKDKGFNVNEFCTSCGICEKICPTSNITLENNIPKWSYNNSCCDCMGCINNCPHKAINIGKKTINKNRYRNPYVKVNELFK